MCLMHGHSLVRSVALSLDLSGFERGTSSTVRPMSAVMRIVRRPKPLFSTLACHKTKATCWNAIPAEANCVTMNKIELWRQIVNVLVSPPLLLFLKAHSSTISTSERRLSSRQSVK